MKRIITIILITILTVGSCVCVSSAASEKYIKVKKSTYQQLKKENKKLEKQLIEMTVKYEDAMDLYELAAEDTEQQSGINTWLWNCISELGFTYKDKTWHQTDPIPEYFKIGKTKYTVVKEY